MRWIGLIFIALVSPAYATTSICRPTFEGFLEFECETRAPQVNAASFCDVMNRQGGPVRWSRSDTNETKNRADLVNAAGKRLCGWKK
jgi:hypothetical protein